MLGRLLDQILNLIFHLDRFRSGPTDEPTSVPIGPCQLFLDPVEHLERPLVGHDMRHLLGHVRIVLRASRTDRRRRGRRRRSSDVRLARTR